MATDHGQTLKKQVLQVETGLTRPILWISGKSKNVEAARRVYFPLPDLSRKIETLLAGYKTSGAQFAIKALSF